MKFSQLQYFCAVCRYNNISKAAELLYVAQPSISIALKDLERELGVALFTRYNNRLSLTVEGAVFLEGAQQILKLQEELIQRVKQRSSQVQHVRLAITPMLGPNFIAPIMKMFHQMQQQFPNGNFEVFETRLNEIPAQLMDCKADFAIVNLDESHFLDFQRVPLYHLPICAYMSRENHLAAFPSLRVEQIKDEPLITSTVSSVVSKTIETWFSTCGCVPKFEKRFSQMSTIRELLKNDMGIILSHCNIGGEDSEIVSVPLADCVEVSVGIIWSADQALSNFAMHMLEQLKKIKLA